MFDGPTPNAIDTEDWPTVVECAIQQGVAPLLYHCIVELPPPLRPPRAVIFRLASIANVNEQQQKQLQHALYHFADRVYEQHKTDTLVVKGLSVARLYPTPYLRVSGDNDIYFGSKAHKIDSWVSSLGIDIDTSDDRHSVFTYEGASFENHLHLLYHAAGENSSADIDPQWNTQPLGGHLTTLVPHELAFFVAAHIDHHATYHNEAIRLRDLIDWALIISNNHLNYNTLNTLKSSYDISRFIDLLTQYSIELFHIPSPKGWIPLSNKATRHFLRMYLTPHHRKKSPLLRVLSRSWNYLRYNGTYKEIYGKSMFRRFYAHNVTYALKQWLNGEERHEGRQRSEK